MIPPVFAPRAEIGAVVAATAKAAAVASEPLLDLLPSADRFFIYYAGDGLTADAAFVTTAGDGQPVDALVDVVNPTFNLTGAGAVRPTYDIDGLNGRAALVFGGAHYLAKGLTNLQVETQMSNSTEYAFYAVASVPDPGSAAQAIYTEGRGSSGGVLGFAARIAKPVSTFQAEVYITGTPAKNLVGGAIAPGAPALITVTRASGTLKLRLNGVEVGSVAMDPASVTNLANNRAMGVWFMFIKQSYLVGKVGFSGRWATLTDLATIESVLASHYGIALP